MITVKHLKVSEDGRLNPSVSDMHTQLAFRADMGMLKAMLKDAAAWADLGLEFKEVATVGSDDLEDAFHVTNSIDSAWYLHPGVAVTPAPGRHRSTSVGDLMIVDGKTYLVDRVGFTEVVL